MHTLGNLPVMHENSVNHKSRRLNPSAQRRPVDAVPIVAR